MKSLCITVHFLHPTVHGRGDGGEPEWPPSPLRLFQALVSAAAGHWNERQLLDRPVPALKWLESLSPPAIIAPHSMISEVRTQFYVPDNTWDLQVPAFKKGIVEALPKRTEKVVRPTHLSGDAVHYLFSSAADVDNHLEILKAAARSMTHLGWGIDMVTGDARMIDEEESATLVGHRWRPVPTGGLPLRVPKVGTLDDLLRKHRDFLNRIDGDGFKPVPPLSCFDLRGFYCPTLQTTSHPFVAFQILDAAGEKYRAFDTARRTRDVAAWTRHATDIACANWPFEDTASFVHGHNPDGSPTKGDRADRRFQYLPLPTINHKLRRTESIRRVMIAAPAGCQPQIDYIRRRLPGQELIWNHQPIGILNLLPTSDWVLSQYVGTATRWSTVTPVIWPGYDDRDAKKAERLLRKSFVDSGIPVEMVDSIENLEWRHVGFRAGNDLAKNYGRPDHLNGSMYHVSVCFAQPIRGPLVVGAGRYRGFGLFAIAD